jgi:signal-transduction protein with cAMP-binding, CBS, and nucleotidyltransferase domain
MQRSTAPGHSSPAAALTGPVTGAMAPPPPAFPPDATLAAVLAAMAAARASAVLAVDPDGRPVGILTEQDVARRVVFRLPPEAPLLAAMTTPVTACTEDAGLWRAVALLRAGHLRHLPVLGRDGRCVGMLHRAETLTAVSGRLLGHLDSLAGDDAAVKAAQAGVAAALLAEGVAARDVVGLVSGINVELHRRVLDRTMAVHGTPPVPFTLLVMGSAGRGESLLRPDQDNALILGDYADDDHGRIDAWFRAFAGDFNRGLDQAGFPLCPGGVMAMNPLWRKTLPQWQRQFEHWAYRRAGAALLFSDIAFDFRAASGDPAPAAALRAHLSRILKANPALLAAMAGQNQALTVGLTLWGGFTDDEPGPGTRTDLKLHGLMPLVAAARLVALSAGVAETGTLARIAELARIGKVSAREAADLAAAFDLLLETVLRQQLADHAAGQGPGNLVDTAALPKAARGDLRGALKAVRSFSRGAFGAFTGQLW